MTGESIAFAIEKSWSINSFIFRSFSLVKPSSRRVEPLASLLTGVEQIWIDINKGFSVRFGCGEARRFAEAVLLFRGTIVYRSPQLNTGHNKLFKW